MPLIKWNDSFSVKVAEIDLQHKKLVDMINELNDAMLQARGKDALAGILQNLTDYVAVHFATEEKYFARYSYPLAAIHIAEHREFEKKVADFRKDFAAGKLGLSIEVMRFLSDWLQQHIKNTDQKYSQFFNRQGLK